MSAAKKVLLAMSGGVDSSVAAAILRRDGYEVVGCFMRLGSPGESLDELIPAEAACTPARIGKQGCCSINDAADARHVAAQLDIPFYVCNFKKDFGRIMDYFVEEYAQGRTPNPCVRCNDWLKFGKLHEYARQIGADYVASGHYARVEGGRLLRGLDHTKDQSYVLFGIPRSQLAHTLLPIGGLQKTAVRALARDFDLPVFNKPDSQEICFIPDNDYAGFVERRRPELAVSGSVVDASGTVVGEHAGQHRYTVGQRRGVRLALGYPVYVTGKDAATNTIRVGGRENLTSRGCTVGEANWLSDEVPDGTRCLAMYRYNSSPVAALVRRLDDAAGSTHSGRVGRFSVQFEEPQHAVAPGQAMVLYGEDDSVLGGGWIEATN